MAARSMSSMPGSIAGVAENAAAQLAKLGGLLGLSPVAERGLGTFTPRDDGDDPYAG